MTLLKRCDVALTDWVRSYAPEFCNHKSLLESSKRVYAAGGTLAYIAALRRDIKIALHRGNKRKRYE